MKKIYLSVVMLGILITTDNFNAQSNIDKSLPDIKPPSAETYKISTYSLDFNNSPSGEFTYNLPIYNINAGINVPVSLGYNSGIKVDDTGNNIGMSWQLVAGGAISRVVRDEQDETSASVWFPGTIDVNADANTIKTAAHPDNSIDTEYDWFSFSLSNGMSGQFYIDKNLNVHYNGGDGSKLTITDKTTIVTQYGKNLEFTFTDNQGNKYYFGGEEKFLERSRIDYKGPDKYYTSGWYLSKIITNKNEEISFDYSVEQISYYASMSASFSISESCCVPNTYENSGITKSKTTMIALKPRLSTIESDVVKLNFLYDKQRKDLLNGDGKLLTSIAVLSKKNNQVIKNFQLAYDDINAGSAVTYYGLPLNEQSTVNRHFLNNVYESISNQKYKFEYYSKESIPARFSLATDFYGYSNGKANQTPFANISGKVPNYILTKTNGWASADKDVDPDKTYLGNLKRIYYPTGGYSEITYESNSSSDLEEVEKSESIGLQISRLCSSPKTMTKSFSFTSNGSPITYSAYASTDYSDCGYPDSHEVHGISITDLTTGQNVRGHSRDYNIPLVAKECITGLPTDYNCPVNTVAGHLYKVEYFVSSYIGRIDGMASVYYNFRKELQTVLKHYGGSRVKKIEENNTENGIYTKWFYYNKLVDKDLQKTSIANAAAPKLFDYIVTKRNCALECNSSGTGNPPLVSFPIPVYRFYKDNILSDYNDRSNKIFYKSITELIDNNKAVEKNYLYAGDSNAYLYDPPILDAPHSNSGQIKRGLLQNEMQYGFNNNNYNIIKSTDYSYNFVQNNVTSFIFKENFSLSPGYVSNPQDGPIPNISYTFYQNYYGFSKLIETTSKEYITNQIVETKSGTTYGNNQHWQPTSQKITFPDNTTQETTYSYAHEKGNQLMIEKNMIGIPLETVSTQTIGSAVKTLSKTSTTYPVSQTEANTKTSGLVLPTSVLSYDLQNLSTARTEVSYDKYDAKGNILQYTTKEGVPVAIVWGYNNTQPIAKVEGATYDQLVSLGVITAIVDASNADALNPAQEGALITALDTFRKNSGLSGYQIRTYTYNPLIGVTSITPPSGIRESYIYDTANRLEKVVDVNGNVLKEMKYNYKN
ncbi:hypothetical protein [Chryseobacterium flavum]|uniref:hypothetical protein n=1 Tax=Chryseobacterium flavum TaxID=415851 RepID=UPI0028ADD5FE|nr:hypothetical protein [Chryseobacterium flavum]